MVRKKTKARRGKLKKGFWSKEEIRFLRKEFPRRLCLDVAKELGRPFYAVKKKAYRLGIYKTKKYLKTLGKS